MAVFLLASGGIVLSALADKVAERQGFSEVGVAIKVVLSIVGLAAGAYVIQTVASGWWLL